MSKIIIVLLLLLSACTTEIKVREDYVILFTNDIHSTTSTYPAIAQYKEDMIERYGENDVVLVDSGDAFQGSIVSTLSSGEWIVEIMNEVGYDIAVPGSHEFDYGVENFMDLKENVAKYHYLASNFTDINGDDMLESYVIKEVGDLKVAFIGIADPFTMMKTDPSAYVDNEGNKLYSFYHDEDSSLFYERIQTKLDELKKDEDIDYIIAIAHLGSDREDDYTSKALIQNTSGIDILIDGESHEVKNETYQDAEGSDVLVVQAGYKGETLGKLIIKTDGSYELSFIATSSIGADNKYRKVADFIADIEKETAELTDEIIATSDYDLIALKDNEFIIRTQETNLADLCTDAYRELYKTDISIINSGAIRADLESGEISYADIIAIQPYFDMISRVEVKGSIIYDALEMGARSLPEASASLLQVSGLRYKVDLNIASSVVTDADGAFIRVSGDRKVTEVEIYDAKADAYVSLDPDKRYTLAISDYLLDGGDGMTMFDSEDVTILREDAMSDTDVIIRYIKEYLASRIPEIYSDPNGDGRITITQ